MAPSVATLLSLDDPVLCKIFRILLRSNLPDGLGGAALVHGRDAFALAQGCRRLLDQFIGCSLRYIDYDFNFLPQASHLNLQSPAHIASILSLSRKRLEGFSLHSTEFGANVDVTDKELAFLIETMAKLCPRLSSLTLEFPAPDTFDVVDLLFLESTAREFSELLETLSTSLRELTLIRPAALVLEALAFAPVAPKQLALRNVSATFTDVHKVLSSLCQGLELLEFWEGTASNMYAGLLKLLAPRRTGGLHTLKLGRIWWRSQWGAVTVRDSSLIRFEHLSGSLRHVVLRDKVLEKVDVAKWRSRCRAQVSLHDCQLTSREELLSETNILTDLWAVLGADLVELRGIEMETLVRCHRAGLPSLETCCPGLTAIGVRRPQSYNEMVALETNIVSNLCAGLGTGLRSLDFSGCGQGGYFLSRALLPCTQVEELIISDHSDLEHAGLQPYAALQGMSKLRSLRMDGCCPVGDMVPLPDSRIFVRLAEYNRALEDLRLTWPSLEGLQCRAEERSSARGQCRELLAAIDLLEMRAPKLDLTEIRSTTRSILDGLW